jgi:hypothetical protein
MKVWNFVERISGRLPCTFCCGNHLSANILRYLSSHTEYDFAIQTREGKGRGQRS